MQATLGNKDIKGGYCREGNKMGTTEYMWYFMWSVLGGGGKSEGGGKISVLPFLEHT